MHRLSRSLFVASLALGATLTPSVTANAQLSGRMTVDNVFRAYLSTSPTVTGTLIASGSFWWDTYSFGPIALTPGQNYWLQVMGTDLGYPAAFLGSFSIGGGTHRFSNGLTTLNTDVTHWAVSATGFVASGGSLVSFGPNGIGPWGPGHPTIDAKAEWVWSSPECGSCTRYFTTAITAIPAEPPPTTTAPEPATLALLLTGLAGLTPVVLRRKG